MKKTNALRILDHHKIEYETLEYSYDSENLDVAKIAADNGLLLKIIYKTLVLNGDKNGTIMAVIAGDRQLSLKKTALVSGNKKVGLFQHTIISKPVTTGPNQNVDYYYWDEVYTTPIGLLTVHQAKNNFVDLGASSTNQQYLTKAPSSVSSVV